MKIKSLILICFVVIYTNGFSQNNKSIINYNLSSSFPENVGGDLVLPNNAICPERISKSQTLFETTSAGTISIEIDNRGDGNNCVTLIVETSNGTIKKIIPENSQSGVLKYNRVRFASLKVEQRLNTITSGSITSRGTATIWF